jgi:hypothetical protein
VRTAGCAVVVVARALWRAGAAAAVTAAGMRTKTRAHSCEMQRCSGGDVRRTQWDSHSLQCGRLFLRGETSE